MSPRGISWKYTEAQKNDIVRRYMNGESNSDICKIYGCDPSYPYRISKLRLGSVSWRRRNNVRAHKEKQDGKTNFTTRRRAR